MEEQVGITAGKIWHYLRQRGRTDVIMIKFELNINNSLLFLALGWLARENKIEILQENNTFFVRLSDGENI